MKIILSKENFWRKGLIFLSLLVLLSVPVIARAGFGISPGTVNIKEALRGTSFEKTFVISRSDPNKDLLIEVEPTGETAEWFQFERGVKFTYPAGEKQFPVKATISIPQGTPNRTYTGKVRFQGGTPLEIEGGGAQVGITLGAVADISITVTDKEVKSFRIIGTQIEKAVEGESLIIALTTENTGNVDIQPDHIVVDLFDEYHKIQLASFTVSQFEGWAKVQNIGRIRATVPWTIPEAKNYWAEISVFNHQNQLVTKQNLPFRVTPGEGILAGVETSNFWLYLIIGIIGGGLILIMIILVIISVISSHRQSKLLNRALLELKGKRTDIKEEKGINRKKVRKSDGKNRGKNKKNSR